MPIKGREKEEHFIPKIESIQLVNAREVFGLSKWKKKISQACRYIIGAFGSSMWVLRVYFVKKYFLGSCTLGLGERKLFIRM